MVQTTFWTPYVKLGLVCLSLSDIILSLPEHIGTIAAYKFVFTMSLTPVYDPDLLYAIVPMATPARCLWFRAPSDPKIYL